MQNQVHSTLETLQELVYNKCGFELTDLDQKQESKEYEAFSFRLNGQLFEHRSSKITPAKTGQFVTIWKRNEAGKTCPFDISDELDFLLVTVKSGENLGQFVFPKAVLANQGIITGTGRAGKRGIRVYPPWDVAENTQAKETQTWQAAYFVEIKNDHSTNLHLASKLFAKTENTTIPKKR